MRLTDEQACTIRTLACQVAWDKCRVRLFGSRLDDAALGRDVDLLLELTEPVDNPALIAAQLPARVSRATFVRKCAATCPICCICLPTALYSGRLL